MRKTNTDRIAVCNCKCHAYGNGNSYWYSFTYTNSNGSALADSQISAYTEAAPDSTAEIIGFGDLGLLNPGSYQAD